MTKLNDYAAKRHAARKLADLSRQHWAALDAQLERQRATGTDPRPVAPAPRPRTGRRDATVAYLKLIR